MVPAAATLYCMGIEALTGEVAGLDLSGINTYRQAPGVAVLLCSSHAACRLAGVLAGAAAQPRLASEPWACAS